MFALRPPFLGLAACALLLAPEPAEGACLEPGDPDCVRLAQAYRGTIDFFATGAAFTVNNDADDRPDDVVDVAEVIVPERGISERARIVQAYLYFGGSLFDEGGEAPDTEVEIEVPGRITFARVRGDLVRRTAPIFGFPEATLYSVRADITHLLSAPDARLAGRYRVRGFEADIFYEGRDHTVANASFSIVLVFEEPRLPPREIALFDGLQEVLGSTVSLDLSGFVVSQQPAGQLTFYALEGDCHPGPENCASGNNLAGTERARVIGESGRTLVLEDAVNPPNDIFNRTINTMEPPRQDVPGTDIDTFDIAGVLDPGDARVSVEITTPFPRERNSGELIGLVYVVVGIDVFAPELRAGSRIDVRDPELGERRAAFSAAETLRVHYALSNTGNLEATGVDVVASVPEGVRGFEVVSAPASARLEVDLAGREIRLFDASIRDGEVEDLVVDMRPPCPLPEGGALALRAEVGAAAEGTLPFSLTASVALSPTVECEPRFFLLGGGGCRTAPGGGSAFISLLVLGALVGLRKRLALALALLAIALSACGGSDEHRPPPAPIGEDCTAFPGMARVPAIRGGAPFCIDRYEASLVDEVDWLLGDRPVDTPTVAPTRGAAASARFALPAQGLTWDEANRACEGAGKRLCTAEEWLVACRGEEDITFPYGETFEPTTCNGYDAGRRGVVESGAMIVPVIDGERTLAGGCVSSLGVYDLSGNVWEWNATSYAGGTRRGLAGGGFRSNENGLVCATEGRHATPEETTDAVGFRCCADAP